MCGTEDAVAHAPRCSSSNCTKPNRPSEEKVFHPMINLDQGDPTMFEPYWRDMEEDKCMLVVSGSELMSYFGSGGLCWFMEAELERSIRNIHRIVGNAAVGDDRHIIVGTGSTQLLHAAFFALSPPDLPKPTGVVCAVPYYSCYREITELLRSSLYKWEGDAHTFDKEGPYIELVTSPNNPDGSIRKSVVDRPGGKLVYDLAYYWPQYTPITHQADYDIMLFTFSKSTGHAGSRIGWAIVKDKEVAEKMVKFVEVTTIGVSKESQLRAAKILGAICDDYQAFGSNSKTVNFFEYTKRLMSERWDRLSEAIEHSELFSISKYPQDYCLFSTEKCEPHPAFAWLKCKDEITDCASLLRGHGILARSGTRFGADPTYVRVSMVSNNELFDLFLERLSSIECGISNGKGKVESSNSSKP